MKHFTLEFLLMKNLDTEFKPYLKPSSDFYQTDVWEPQTWNIPLHWLE